MNLLPKDKRIPLTKKDMMGQTLHRGDVVWWFTGGSGGYNKELTVVTGETAVQISVLGNYSGRKRHAQVSSLLKHSESWGENIGIHMLRDKINKQEEEIK